MVVVVIGAGIAGLTIARDLSKAKIPIVVLEAQSRLGGRVFTTADGYDLGASWLHDSENNELFPVAQKLGVPLAFDEEKFGFYERGMPVPEKIVEKAGELLQSAGNAAPHESLHDWMVNVTRDISDPTERKLVLKAAQMMEHWSGLSWYELAAAASVPHFSTPDAFSLGGNSRLVQWLLHDIDRAYGQIRTDTPVRRVTESSKQYRIELESGEIINADYVVCTMPVGAMKELRPFALELPEPLRKALDTATMATLGKIVLEYETRWWDDSLDRMEVFADVDPETYKPPVNGTLVPGEQPIFFTNAYKAVARPALIALISSPLTQYVEAHPEQAVTMLTPALQQIRGTSFKDRPVPQPAKVLVTDWTQNRFFRGSYCEVSVNQNPEEIIGAFATGAGNLRFAGEHTSIHGAGCMHGAYFSGQREAAWIANKLGKSLL